MTRMILPHYLNKVLHHDYMTVITNVIPVYLVMINKDENIRY